jgi:hypothetical protein
MSTELILYPQNYNGYSTSTTAATEYVVDGQFFSTFNSAASITQSGSYGLIVLALGSNINTWYRGRTNAAVSYPTEVNTDVHFNTVAGFLYGSYAYQRLTNLTVGQIYTITVTF